MVNHKKYSWKSFDNLTYFAQSWECENPKAIINLIHGIGEHSSRYDEWAGWFVENGYTVLSFDYRGHGRSEGKKGYIPNYESIMKDIDLILSKSDELFPNIPKILYGHSLGGNFTLNYLLRRKPDIKCAIVTSPWIKLAFDPPKAKIFVGKILRSLFPKLTQSSGLHTSDLTQNEGAVDKYKEDEFVHNRVSVQLFFSTYESGLWALENASKLNIPLLLMHGSADNITSHKASKEFSERSPKNTHFKSWDGYYHELHNEVENKKVFDYITTWLKSN